jgi:hypothetical protein
MGWIPRLRGLLEESFMASAVTAWRQQPGGTGRYTLSPATERALEEFGGIRIDLADPGNECALNLDFTGTIQGQALLPALGNVFFQEN